MSREKLRHVLYAAIFALLATGLVGGFLALSGVFTRSSPLTQEAGSALRLQACAFFAMFFASVVGFVLLVSRDFRAGLRRRDEELNRVKERFRAQEEKLKGTNMYLESLAEKLREMNRLKSDFMANMSHELRSPLNSILGYTELLLEENPGLDKAIHADLDVVRKHAFQLLALINDILDIAKIEAGKVDVVVSDFSLAELVRAEMDSIRPLLREDDVRLVADIAQDIPLLRTDREKMRQIMANLLSNAAKFTNAGEIKVTARLTTEPPHIERSRTDRLEQRSRGRVDTAAIPPSGPYLLVSVSDTGMGIPPAEQKSVFQEFRQVDGSSTRRFGGTGLGLAIVKKTIAILRGDVELSSEPGEGSTFTLHFPARISPQHARAARDTTRKTARKTEKSRNAVASTL